MTDPRNKQRADKLAKLALDLGAIAGAGVFTYGFWMYSHPLGPIVGGLLIALGCVFAGYDRARNAGLGGGRQ